MKKRSHLAGVVRRCSVVLNDVRCDGALTAAQAGESVARTGRVLCTAHLMAHVKWSEPPAVDPVAEAYNERRAARERAALATLTVPTLDGTAA